MPRSNSNLASVDDANEDAPFGFKSDGTPRKRAARAGEKRNRKPIRVVYTVSDAEGNQLEGARVEYLFAGTSNDAYLDAVDSNPRASRGKIILSGKEEQPQTE